MTFDKSSLSLIVPAFNEEGNLETAVRDLKDAMAGRFSDYEILIFNDGSTDRTAIIADSLAADDPHIRVIHHMKNRGLGYVISRGYKSAAKDYVMWYPGDNGMQRRSLDVMFENAGKADMVIPYIANPEFRSHKRQRVSGLYVGLINVLFGLRLKYYNGVVVYRTELVKSASACTHGFASIAELLIRLVKAGYSYIEVPTYHQQRKHGASKAFRFQNFRDIAWTFAKLIWSLNIKHENPLNLVRRRELREARHAKDAAENGKTPPHEPSCR